jgi:hypothetical protein
VLGANAVGVEALRETELSVDVDDETLAATVRALFAHEVDSEVAGELDQAVVAGFCDDEDAGEIGMDACTTWAAL